MKRVFFLFKQSTLVYFRTTCYDRVDGVLSLETQNNIIVIQSPCDVFVWLCSIKTNRKPNI